MVLVQEHEQGVQGVEGPNRSQRSRRRPERRMLGLAGGGDEMWSVGGGSSGCRRRRGHTSGGLASVWVCDGGQVACKNMTPIVVGGMKGWGGTAFGVAGCDLRVNEGEKPR